MLSMAAAFLLRLRLRQYTATGLSFCKVESAIVSNDSSSTLILILWGPPKDEEAAKYWEEAGIPKERIYFLKENWWIAGEEGPCGPCLLYTSRCV